MTKEEKIIQATKDYEEAKRLLYKSYAERFEELPVSECGEVDADAVLALNEWAENESRKI